MMQEQTEEVTVESLTRTMEQAFEEQAGYPAGTATDVGIRIRTLAGELYALYSRLEFFRRQSFPSTAGGAYLDEHARMRGLARKAAGTAAGEVLFYRGRSEEAARVDYDPLKDPLLSAPVEIPKGTICSTSGTDPRQFVTTQACGMAAGEWEVSAPVQAAASGRSYNAAPGAVNTVVNAPQGITGVINRGYLYGGADEESDAALRRRIEQSYSSRDNGVNARYYQEKAMAFEEVVSAGVLPRVRGDGTVDVVIRTHTNEGQELIDRITREIEANRELCCDVQVRYAAEHRVQIVLDVTAYYGSDREQTALRCRSAVDRYVDALAVGEPMRLSVLTGAVMAVEEVLHCRVTAPGGDVVPPRDCYTSADTAVTVSME